MICKKKKRDKCEKHAMCVEYTNFYIKQSLVRGYLYIVVGTLAATSAVLTFFFILYYSSTDLVSNSPGREIP